MQMVHQGRLNYTIIFDLGLPFIRGEIICFSLLTVDCRVDLERYEIF
jgi:hypothetical protein